MSLIKRGSVWWIDFVSPSGERVRRSTQTGNRAQAQELHDRLKSEVWRVHKLVVSQGTLAGRGGSMARRTVSQGVARGCKEKLRFLDGYLDNRNSRYRSGTDR